MTSDKNTPLIKPSDAKSWSLCARRVWLDNKGEFEQSPIEDEFEQLVIQLGLEHENAVLQRIASTREVHTATSSEDTKRLMADGVQVIYQARLRNRENGLTGYPDFLIRHESGEYQPADAKLSLSEQKKEIQVQLGFYRRMLGSKLPAIVFLGDGSEALIGDEANAITNRFVTEMRELLTSDEEPKVRYSHSKCRACPYYINCCISNSSSCIIPFMSIKVELRNEKRKGVVEAIVIRQEPVHLITRHHYCPVKLSNKFNWLGMSHSSVLDILIVA